MHLWSSLIQVNLAQLFPSDGFFSIAFSVLSLSALGLIGVGHQKLLDHLPWAARFERQLEVRAQACQVAPILCPGHQPMIQVLNDLLVADESDEVRRLVSLRLYVLHVLHPQQYERAKRKGRRGAGALSCTEHVGT